MSKYINMILLGAGIGFFATSIYMLHLGDIASSILAAGIGYLLLGLGLEERR